MAESIPNMPPEQQEPGQEIVGLRSDLSKDDLETILQDIKEQNRERRVMVAESVFREFFLNAFTDSSKIDKNIRAWAGLVNGFNRWANVVDDLSQRFLFEVPPLFNTNTFNAAAPTDLNVPTLNNVISMAIQNTSTRPMQRTAAIRDSTLAYLGTRVDKNLNPEFVEAWRRIYAYYNIEFTMDAAGKAQEPDQAPQASTQLDDEERF